MSDEKIKLWGADRGSETLLDKTDETKNVKCPVCNAIMTLKVIGSESVWSCNCNRHGKTILSETEAS